MSGILSENAFAGQRALVTGSSRGIGRATALAFARHGATVIVNYRADEAGVEETLRLAQDFGGRVFLYRADLSNPEELERMVAEAEERFGTLDVLVNNAAAFNRQPFLEVSLDDFDSTFNTNIRGVFALSQAAARRMARRGRGSIINVSSILATLSVPNRSAYSASKGALESLTRAMALELISYGIRVNAVSPGLIRTEAMTAGFKSPELLADVERHIPGGKFGQPEDIAHAVLFLASDLAAYINGIVLPVDQGLSSREAGPAPRW